MSATVLRADRIGPDDEPGIPRPVLTATVFAVTLVVSLAALASPALLHQFTRDLPGLRAGQWWRVVTPLLVQPSGWGQLMFNMLGIAVVGAALQRHLGWASWSLIYLVGGSGSIAVYSAWHPTDTGGGSSAAVAALIGAFLVVLNVDRGSGGLEWFAQLYSVFFAVYLSTLDLGGVIASILAGNATIIAMFIMKHALAPVTLTRGSTLVVLAASVAMILARDDHGVGLAVGFVLAAVVLGRRRLLERRQWQLAVAIPGVLAATMLTWFGWVHLLGISLQLDRTGGREYGVGWLGVGLVSAAACVAAAIALRLVKRHSPARGVQIWIGVCLGVAFGSVIGPLLLGVGRTGTAALISLQLVCVAAILGLLTPHEPRS